MKKRSLHFLSFTGLLIIEVCIGAFVHDDFIRPYVGDLLVTVLLCCLVRVIFPERCFWLPAAVFAFAVTVECVQLIDFPALDGTFWGILLGSTFDFADIVCYGIGCILFAIIDGTIRSNIER